MAFSREQIEIMAKKYIKWKEPAFGWPPPHERDERNKKVWNLIREINEDKSLSLKRKEFLLYGEGWEYWPYHHDILHELMYVHEGLGDQERHRRKQQYGEALHVALLIIGLWDIWYEGIESEITSLFVKVQKYEPEFAAQLLEYLEA